MPCVSHESNLSDKEWEDAKKPLKDAYNILDVVTQLLCYACREFNLSGKDIDTDEYKALMIWYERHKKFDDARKASEEK
jgi:hypothetical protein